MARRDFILLWGLALVALGLGASLVPHPGYADAAAYHGVAVNLATGRGLVQDFIWTYLGSPAAVTHPSNLYWMPLASFVLAPVLLILGPGWRTAQLAMVVVASGVPLLGACVGDRLLGTREGAWATGLLTLFCVPLFPYWSATDNFGVFALVALGCFLATDRACTPSAPPASWALAAGLMAGLGHLSRADGLLLLLAALVLAFRRRSGALRLAGAVVAGYGLVMVPWFFRTWTLTGAPLPVAGMRTAFLARYDDIFAYGTHPSLASFLAQGPLAILCSRGYALLHGLAVLVAVAGPVAVFVPWGAAGLHRRGPLHLAFGVYASLLLGSMGLVFAYPGMQGAMLHSSGALVPWLAALGLAGLERFVTWISGVRRGWEPVRARRTLTLCLVTTAVLASAAWGLRLARRWERYGQGQARLVRWIAGNAPDAGVVMVQDPPGFVHAGGGPAIVAPTDSLDAARAAARRYGATHLVLEELHGAVYAGLWAGAEPPPWLVGVGGPPGTRVFRFDLSDVP